MQGDMMSSFGRSVMRQSRFLRPVLLGVGLAIALTGQAVPNATAQSAEPAATAAAPYASEGFRSARFGMTEADVRKAIAADFKIDDKTIGRESNDVERTVFLTVTVADLLSGAGPARISYIFGYSKHQLIQVNL